MTAYLVLFAFLFNIIAAPFASAISNTKPASSEQSDYIRRLADLKQSNDPQLNKQINQITDIITNHLSFSGPIEKNNKVYILSIYEERDSRTQFVLEYVKKPQQNPAPFYSPNARSNKNLRDTLDTLRPQPGNVQQIPGKVSGQQTAFLVQTNAENLLKNAYPSAKFNLAQIYTITETAILKNVIGKPVWETLIFTVLCSGLIFLLNNYVSIPNWIFASLIAMNVFSSTFLFIYNHPKILYSLFQNPDSTAPASMRDRLFLGTLSILMHTALILPTLYLPMDSLIGQLTIGFTLSILVHVIWNASAHMINKHSRSGWVPLGMTNDHTDDDGNDKDEDEILDSEEGPKKKKLKTSSSSQVPDDPEEQKKVLISEQEDIIRFHIKSLGWAAEDLKAFNPNSLHTLIVQNSFKIAAKIFESAQESRDPDFLLKTFQFVESLMKFFPYSYFEDIKTHFKNPPAFPDLPDEKNPHFLTVIQLNTFVMLYMGIDLNKNLFENYLSPWTFNWENMNRRVHTVILDPLKIIYNEAESKLEEVLTSFKHDRLFIDESRKTIEELILPYQGSLTANTIAVLFTIFKNKFQSEFKNWIKNKIETWLESGFQNETKKEAERLIQIFLQNWIKNWIKNELKNTGKNGFENEVTNWIKNQFENWVNEKQWDEVVKIFDQYLAPEFIKLVKIHELQLKKNIDHPQYEKWVEIIEESQDAFLEISSLKPEQFPELQEYFISLSKDLNLNLREPRYQIADQLYLAIKSAFNCLERIAGTSTFITHSFVLLRFFNFKNRIPALKEKFLTLIDKQTVTIKLIKNLNYRLKKDLGCTSENGFPSFDGLIHSLDDAFQKVQGFAEFIRDLSTFFCGKNTEIDTITNTNTNSISNNTGLNIACNGQFEDHAKVNDAIKMKIGDPLITKQVRDNRTFEINGQKRKFKIVLIDTEYLYKDQKAHAGIELNTIYVAVKGMTPEKQNLYIGHEAVELHLWQTFALNLAGIQGKQWEDLNSGEQKTIRDQLRRWQELNSTQAYALAESYHNTANQFYTTSHSANDNPKISKRKFESEDNKENVSPTLESPRKILKPAKLFPSPSDEKKDVQLQVLAETPTKKARDFSYEVVSKLIKQGWKRYNENQSLVVFKVTENKNVNNTITPGKRTINGIHKKTLNVVGPSSYSDKRIRQTLRWISTIAFIYLKQKNKDPREVQSLLHEGQIYMASNTSKGNKALINLAKDKTTAMAVIEAMLSQINKSKISPREMRHIKKFKERIQSDSSAKTDQYKEIKYALKNNKLVIAAKGEDGLHAERRLALEVNQTALNPAKIGGIKRPCATCSLLLFDENVRSGPFWPSSASNLNWAPYLNQDPERAAEEINKKIKNTYVSIDFKNNKRPKATYDYDTDSDSENDSFKNFRSQVSPLVDDGNWSSELDKTIVLLIDLSLNAADQYKTDDLNQVMWGVRNSYEGLENKVKMVVIRDPKKSDGLVIPAGALVFESVEDTKVGINSRWKQSALVVFTFTPDLWKNMDITALCDLSRTQLTIQWQGQNLVLPIKLPELNQTEHSNTFQQTLRIIIAQH